MNVENIIFTDKYIDVDSLFERKEDFCYLYQIDDNSVALGEKFSQLGIPAAKGCGDYILLLSYDPSILDEESRYNNIEVLVDYLAKTIRNFNKADYRNTFFRHSFWGVPVSAGFYKEDENRNYIMLYICKIIAQNPFSALLEDQALLLTNGAIDVTKIYG